VVSVGPLECMPNKVAEAQFFHVTEREGLPSMTLPVNGDPVDPAVLDSFAFEVQESARRRRDGLPPEHKPQKLRLRVIRGGEGRASAGVTPCSMPAE